MPTTTSDMNTPNSFFGGVECELRMYHLNVNKPRTSEGVGLILAQSGRKDDGRGFFNLLIISTSSLCFQPDFFCDDLRYVNGTERGEKLE